MGINVGEGMGGTAVGGTGDIVDVGPSLIGVRLGGGVWVGWIVPGGAHAVVGKDRQMRIPRIVRREILNLLRY
ncbi:MAG: hypothetical protein AMJ88_10125 [Anaerolineae bacterium SM23_ 63]|nr:MAG: hypothetical protein AMJ88_10125 [Anaerolineae bacterium SM23_ 63]HEY46235.1 hypothetical protein [Anaerolineae bacterium]